MGGYWGGEEEKRGGGVEVEGGCLIHSCGAIDLGVRFVPVGSDHLNFRALTKSFAGFKILCWYLGFVGI